MFTRLVRTLVKRVSLKSSFSFFFILFIYFLLYYLISIYDSRKKTSEHLLGRCLIGVLLMALLGGFVDKERIDFLNIIWKISSSIEKAQQQQQQQNQTSQFCVCVIDLFIFSSFRKHPKKKMFSIKRLDFLNQLEQTIEPIEYVQYY